MKNISFQHDILPMKDKFFRLALRITLNRQDAEDIVQETLIKIWNRRESWDNIESLEAWGLTIARNMAIDVARKQESHRTVSIDEPLPNQEEDSSDLKLSQVTASSPTTVASTPYENLQEKERMEMVKNLMNSLPEKQRTAMQLRDFEEKSYKEIAAIMNVTEEQVKVNIYRARQFIKMKYSELSQYGL